MDTLKLREQIKQLIVEELDLRDVSATEINDDSPDALQLAMAVEERYAVELPDDERAREIFASVAVLSDYILRMRAT
jgi:acyl carrier protein